MHPRQEGQTHVHPLHRWGSRVLGNEQRATNARVEKDWLSIFYTCYRHYSSCMQPIELRLFDHLLMHPPCGPRYDHSNCMHNLCFIDKKASTWKDDDHVSLSTLMPYDIPCPHIWARVHGAIHDDFPPYNWQAYARPNSHRRASHSYASPDPHNS
jgi:hypothetical protein